MAELLALVTTITTVDTVVGQGLKLCKTFKSVVTAIKGATEEARHAVRDLEKTVHYLKQLETDLEKLRTNYPGLVGKGLLDEVTSSVNECELLFREMSDALEAVMPGILNASDGAEGYVARKRYRLKWPYSKQQIADISAKLGLHQRNLSDFAGAISLSLNIYGVVQNEKNTEREEQARKKDMKLKIRMDRKKVELLMMRIKMNSSSLQKFSEQSNAQDRPRRTATSQSLDSHFTDTMDTYEVTTHDSSVQSEQVDLHAKNRERPQPVEEPALQRQTSSAPETSPAHEREATAEAEIRDQQAQIRNPDNTSVHPSSPKLMRSTGPKVSFKDYAQAEAPQAEAQQGQNPVEATAQPSQNQLLHSTTAVRPGSSAVFVAPEPPADGPAQPQVNQYSQLRVERREAPMSNAHQKLRPNKSRSLWSILRAKPSRPAQQPRQRIELWTHHAMLLANEEDSWHTLTLRPTIEEFEAIIKDFTKKRKTIWSYCDRIAPAQLRQIESSLAEVCAEVGAVSWSILAMEIAPKHARTRDIRSIKLVAKWHQSVEANRFSSDAAPGSENIDKHGQTNEEQLERTRERTKAWTTTQYARLPRSKLQAEPSKLVSRPSKDAHPMANVSEYFSAPPMEGTLPVVHPDTFIDPRSAATMSDEQHNQGSPEPPPPFLSNKRILLFPSGLTDATQEDANQQIPVQSTAPNSITESRQSEDLNAAHIFGPQKLQHVTVRPKEGGFFSGRKKQIPDQDQAPTRMHNAPTPIQRSTQPPIQRSVQPYYFQTPPTAPPIQQSIQPYYFQTPPAVPPTQQSIQPYSFPLLPAAPPIQQSIQPYSFPVPPAAPPVQQPAQPPIQQSTQPSMQQSTQPSMQQSTQPSMQQSTQPSMQQSTQPPIDQSIQPSTQQSTQPSTQQSTQPSVDQSTRPPTQQSTQPPIEQSTHPQTQNSMQPSVEQSVQPYSFQTSPAAPQYMTYDPRWNLQALNTASFTYPQWLPGSGPYGPMTYAGMPVPPYGGRNRFSTYNYKNDDGLAGTSTGAAPDANNQATSLSLQRPNGLAYGQTTRQNVGGNLGRSFDDTASRSDISRDADIRRWVNIDGLSELDARSTHSPGAEV